MSPRTLCVATLVLITAAGGLARSRPTPRENRWPRDPALLLQRLNSWDREELDVVERPRVHRGRVASGETNGWVDSNKRMLRAIGYAVRWDPARRRYAMRGGAAKDWVERDPTAYLGRYETSVFVDNDPRDRAAGRGGSGVKVIASIELGKRGGRLTAEYAVAPADKPRSRTTARLSGVKVHSSQIATNPVAVKSAWPYYLPELFEGRFVKPTSLIFDGRLYHRVGKPR